jgi:uncharacterized protein
MSQLHDIKDTLRKIKPDLVKRFHVRSIGLFGSVVRDDFSASQSDIDIVVEFSTPVGIEFIDLANFLESQFKRKVDLVSKKGIKKAYFDEIEREIVYV